MARRPFPLLQDSQLIDQVLQHQPGTLVTRTGVSLQAVHVRPELLGAVNKHIPYISITNIGGVSFERAATRLPWKTPAPSPRRQATPATTPAGLAGRRTCTPESDPRTIPNMERERL